MPSDSIESVERKIALLSSKMQDESMVTGVQELKDYAKYLANPNGETRERTFNQTRDKLKMFLLANDGTEISEDMKTHFRYIYDEVEAIKTDANIGVFGKMFNSEKKKSRRAAREQMERAKQLKANQDETLENEQTMSTYAPEVFDVLNDTEEEFSQAFSQPHYDEVYRFEREARQYDKAFIKQSTKAKYLRLRRMERGIEAYNDARLQFSTDASDLYTKMYIRGVESSGEFRNLTKEAANLTSLSNVAKWDGTPENYEDARKGYETMLNGTQQIEYDVFMFIKENYNIFFRATGIGGEDAWLFRNVDVYALNREKLDYEIEMVNMLQQSRFMNEYVKTEEGARAYDENQKLLQRLTAGRDFFDSMVKYVDAKEDEYRGNEMAGKAQAPKLDTIEQALRESGVGI